MVETNSRESSSGRSFLNPCSTNQLSTMVLYDHSHTPSLGPFFSSVVSDIITRLVETPVDLEVW